MLGRDSTCIKQRQLDILQGRSAIQQVKILKDETKPPVRYTEASLVKALEAAGVGRPSTYATIIDTILNRKYAFKQRRELVPTFTAFAVTELMEGALERCDEEGLIAYLESSNPANIPLYQRHGFEIIGEIQAPGTPVVTPMLRPAR